MKTKIEVKDRDEAMQLKAGLERRDVRAFVRIVGLLDPLSDRGRKRVLAYVKDKLDEEQSQ